VQLFRLRLTVWVSRCAPCLLCEGLYESVECGMCACGCGVSLPVRVPVPVPALACPAARATGVCWRVWCFACSCIVWLSRVAALAVGLCGSGSGSGSGGYVHTSHASSYPYYDPIARSIFSKSGERRRSGLPTPNLWSTCGSRKAQLWLVAPI
jgi:hypothetical protein